MAVFIYAPFEFVVQQSWLKWWTLKPSLLSPRNHFLFYSSSALIERSGGESFFIQTSLAPDFVSPVSRRQWERVGLDPSWCSSSKVNRDLAANDRSWASAIPQQWFWLVGNIDVLFLLLEWTLEMLNSCEDALKALHISSHVKWRHLGILRLLVTIPCFWWKKNIVMKSYVVGGQQWSRGTVRLGQGWLQSHPFSQRQPKIKFWWCKKFYDAMITTMDGWMDR